MNSVQLTPTAPGPRARGGQQPEPLADQGPFTAEAAARNAL